VAARDVFAERGLSGASTDEIARRAGISQPYLFRLFRTKKELFIASVERCFAETRETFEQAAEGKTGEEALRAMGQAYGELIRSNPTGCAPRCRPSRPVRTPTCGGWRGAATAGSSTPSGGSPASTPRRSRGSSPRAC
jgi:AcrR family transcriptional regulator